MTRIHVCLMIFIFLAPAARAAGDITLSPGPDDRYRSVLYTVTVDDAGPAFVYFRENGWKAVPDKDGGNWDYSAMSADNNWVSLSTTGDVALTIKPVGVAATNAELLPEREGNGIAVAADGTVRVELKWVADQANYYFVRINGDYGNKHPLFIFVDAPEKAVPVRGPGVHFFEPGVHDIGPHYDLKSNDTVYIAAGAVVRGTFTAKGSGIKVCGRGVLSGELLQEEWIRHKRGFIEKPKDARSWGIVPMVWNDGGADAGTVVEGITIIDAPSYCLISMNGKIKIQNVKMLAWNYSTDGVHGTAEVEKCFFKVNDDVIAWFHSDLVVRNLVIWKQLNASVFQLGYGYSTTVKNCLAEHIDIIRDESTVQCGARSIISLEASKGCSFTGLTFRDITVYGDTLNLLAIDNLNQDTPWAEKVKEVKLREIDLVLQRVKVTGTERGHWWTPFMERKGQPMRSRLRTADSGSIQVLFDDVSIHGKKLQSATDFPNGLELSGAVNVNFW